MNLILELSEPNNKRLKLENNREKSCQEKEKEITENILDSQKISLEHVDSKQLADDNKILVVNDSDDESFKFPPDEDISDMLDEVQYSDHFPTITERYLTPFYKMNVQSLGDDICIHIHSNRICILSLAPSHLILQGDKNIKKIDFKVSDKLDRSLNKVSGKGKHGAQPLQTNSNICTILCSDGQTHMIKCCMIGKLVEVNEMLSENPQLLREPPHKGGYLAIILPNIKLLENLKQSLLTHEQYTELVKERERK